MAVPFESGLAAIEGRARGVAAGGPAHAARLVRALAPVVVAWAGVAVAVHPLFLAGLLPHADDVDTFFAPSWQFLAHSLALGRIPQWNPFVFGGAPFAGDPQTQALYPPTILLFGTLSLPAATVSWFACHYLLAAAGTYRLGRNLALCPRAAAVASIAFAGSTYLVARVQAPALLVGAAWIPAVLAATVGGSLTRSAAPPGRLSWPLALAFALQIVSGGPQVVLLTATACVLVSLTLGSRALALRTVVSLALGALLAAPQLLPTLVLLEHSTISAGIASHGGGALSWVDRALLAGSFSRTTSETAPLYAGVCGLGLAAVGIWAARKRRVAHTVLALGLLSLVWALGWVGRLVVLVFPPLASVTAHQAVRALPLAMLALALAIGAYWEQPHSRRAVAAVGALSALGFAFAGTLGPVSAHVLAALALATGAAIVTASLFPRASWPVVLFAAVLTLDLAVHNVNLRNTHQPPAVWQSAARLYPPAPATVDVLRDRLVGLAGPRVVWLAARGVRQNQLDFARTPLGRVLMLNGGSQRYRLPTLSGYNPLMPTGWADLVSESNRSPILERHFANIIRARTQLLRVYAVGAYVCMIRVCPHPGRIVWRSRGVAIVSDPSALPFARLASRDRSAAVPLRASWPNTDTIDVTAPSGRARAGLVSVAVRAAPGWHVSVDGRPAPLSPAGLGELRVHAPAGWRRVRFSYEAPGLRIGLAVAALATLAAGGIGVFRRLVPRA